jgi:hypothetical protein
MLSIVRTIIAKRDTTRWFAHNGGGFDFKYIVNNDDCLRFISKNGYSINIIGGNICKALVLKKGKKSIFICDSYKIMPMSLGKLASGLKVKTPKGFIDFEHGEIFDKTNPTHREYLKADVISLHEVVTKYREIVWENFGSEIKCTAASTAFNAFQTTIPEDKPIWKHSKAASDFARLAYYGGRTEAFYQGEVSLCSYIDVNSLYPYCMETAGGLENPIYTTEYVGTGFYRVNVTVPVSAKFGLVPYRTKTGTIFPAGSFQTVCSSVELEYARENGAIFTVIEGYAFSQNKEMFQTFVANCKRMRQVDYKGATGLCAKFLQNNLYGFFGMHLERDSVVFSESLPDDNFVQVLTDNGEVIPNLWTRKELTDTINCIPAIAAWITANARVHLLKAMHSEERSGNTVLYCDTDSIILQGKPVSSLSQSEYGLFKLEYENVTYTGITAKTYMINDGEEKAFMRCKGIPSKLVKPEFFADSLENVPNVVEYIQLNSLVKSVKADSLGRNASRTIPRILSITSRESHGKNTFTTPIKLG